jgi:hypothetical protein
MFLLRSHAPYAAISTQLKSSVTATETTGLIAQDVIAKIIKSGQRLGRKVRRKLRVYGEKRSAVNGSSIGIINHPRLK